MLGYSWGHAANMRKASEAEEGNVAADSAACMPRPLATKASKNRLNPPRYRAPASAILSAANAPLPQKSPKQ
jgi:hypothetical protein